MNSALCVLLASAGCSCGSSVTGGTDAATVAEAGSGADASEAAVADAAESSDGAANAIDAADSATAPANPYCSSSDAGVHGLDAGPTACEAPEPRRESCLALVRLEASTLRLAGYTFECFGPWVSPFDAEEARGVAEAGPGLSDTATLIYDPDRTVWTTYAFHEPGTRDGPARTVVVSSLAEEVVLDVAGDDARGYADWLDGRELAAACDAVEGWAGAGYDLRSGEPLPDARVAPVLDAVGSTELGPLLGEYGEPDFLVLGHRDSDACGQWVYAVLTQFDVEL